MLLAKYIQHVASLDEMEKPKKKRSEDFDEQLNVQRDASPVGDLQHKLEFQFNNGRLDKNPR